MTTLEVLQERLQNLDRLEVLLIRTALRKVRNDMRASESVRRKAAELLED